jgi:hypothetical protein
MKRKKYPDHRIQNVQLPEQSDNAEIYAAANFESDFRLSRKDFLRECATLAGIAALAPMLLQGCATMNANVKVKVPKKVRIRKGSPLLDAPGGNTIGIVEKDSGELLEFIEEKDGFVKVKAKGAKNPLWVAKRDAIYEEFTEKIQPCGTPIPSGYVCTCNCVPVATPRPRPRTRTRRYCTCDKVCTCNLVPVYR